MKSSILSTTSKLLFFVFVSAFILLMSFSPTKGSINDPKSLSNAELSKLVDSALKDSTFEMITKADIRRFFDIIKSNKSISKQQWTELAKKKDFSTQETEFIFSLFGFKSVEDLISYADLLASLGKKYGIDRLDKNGQNMFFEILRKKQDEYITNNRLLETYNADMPSECWKCVYDFRDCTTGTSGNWVVNFTNYSSTWTLYDFTNGGVSITRFDYKQPGHAVNISFVNTQYSSATCEGMYRNCMSSCATP